MDLPRVAQQERSEKTRAEILQIALELFSIYGFAAVSLREIAEKAGVNHAMIRYHFGNKEALWRASATFLFERINEEVWSLKIDGGTIREQLKTYVRHYIRYCARHPEHARLLLQEFVSASDRLKWVAETYIRPAHERTLKLVKIGALQEGLEHIDPVTLLYMIVSLAQMPYLVTAELQFTHNRDALSAEAIEAHADAVVALLFRD